jgi:hypothetical protein
MLPPTISRVSSALGREVLESERGMIKTFNDLTPDMLAKAREIRRTRGRLDTSDYLRFFVATHSDSDAEAFCEEVIENGEDASTWKFADCLCGGYEFEHKIVTQTVTQYRRSFDGLEGERWFTTRAITTGGGGIPIAETGPGLIFRDTRYHTQFAKPHGDVALRYVAISPKYETVERIEENDLDVEIRRWMASTAAWWANKYLLAEGARSTVEGVIAAYPEPITPSPDGMIAVQALVQEVRSGDPRWPGQVGFIGPDSWYRP